MNEWQSSEHASAYLKRANRVPHRVAGETALIDEIPRDVRRVLDLGSGDGRLLDSVLRERSHAKGVALDFSPHMLDQLRTRFGPKSRTDIVHHNLKFPLPSIGMFDAVVRNSIHGTIDEPAPAD